MSDKGSDSGGEAPETAKAEPRMTRRSLRAEGAGNDGEASTPPLLAGLDSRRPSLLLGSPDKTAQAGEARRGKDSVIRVGAEFQAVMPEVGDEEKVRDVPERCVWAPTAGMEDAALNAFVSECREGHGYSEEQALGILFMQGYHLDKARTAVAAHAPASQEWSLEERVAFEQAFALHGKFFARIRSMMPTKSNAELVHYYYGWKQRRKYTSLFDQREEGAGEDIEEWVYADPADALVSCLHCGERTPRASAQPLPPPPKDSVQPTPQHGLYCDNCRFHYAQSGKLDWESPIPTLKPRKAVLPAGFQVTAEGTLAFLTPAEEASGRRSGGEAGLTERSQGEAYLEEMEQRTGARKREAARLLGSLNRTYEALSAMETRSLNAARAAADLDDETRRQRRTFHWSKSEERLAVLSLRHYGKDYEAMAAILSTKSPEQCRVFYREHATRWALDKLVEAAEADRKKAKEEAKAKVAAGEAPDEVMEL